jgi:hypothetical protein
MMLNKAVFPQSGSLAFWGDIFGGRYGNRHRIIEYKYNEVKGIYSINFNESEICTIYDPEAIEYGRKAFIIKDASRIVWEWYYYGREKTASNLNRLDYNKINASLVRLERHGNLATEPRITTFEIQNQPALKFY